MVTAGTTTTPSSATVRSRRWTIGTMGFVALWGMANLVWFEVHRAARLWDHEEVTYAQLVMRFAERRLNRPWAELYSDHYGPMQALLGAPSQWLFGTNEATVVWVNMALTALTGLIVFFVVRRLADAPAGLVACALVLLTPGMLENSRGALTMVPATTFAAAAIGALVAGGGLRRPVWSAVAGIAIGCMSLSRPMSLAFVPGMVVPALAWSRSTDTARRDVVRNGSIVVVGAFLTSIWWWVLSVDEVLDYLAVGAVGVGTGSVSEVLDHRLYELQAYLGPVTSDSWLGFTALSGGVAYALLVRRRASRPVQTPQIRSAADRVELPLWPLGAAIVIDIVVSLTSNTIGWLMLPVVPWIVVLTVAAARRRLGRIAWPTWVAVVLVPVLVIAVLSSTRWAEPGNRFTWCMQPWQTTSACDIDDGAQAALWKGSLRAISGAVSDAHDALEESGRTERSVAIAARGHVVLPATIRFEGWVQRQRWVEDPGALPQDLAIGLQVEQVQGGAGIAVIVPDPHEVVLFKSNVEPGHLRKELLDDGFGRCDEVELPDGRVVDILVREPVPAAACG